MHLASAHRACLRWTLLAVLCLPAAGAPARERGSSALGLRLSRLPYVRRFEPRLSLAVEYRRCDHPAPGSRWRSAVECDRSPPLASEEAIDLAARAKAALDARGDPEALHVLGVLDLASASPEDRALRQAISSLSAAATLAPEPAAILADLSAAYLVRSERLDAPGDAWQAVEAAARGVAADSSEVHARFNLALALSTVGLSNEATHAWRAYLRVDSASAWADEARRRLAALAADTVRPAKPAPGAPPGAYARYAEAMPQDALLLAWNGLLGDWGGAVLAGDSATARQVVADVRAIAGVLDRRNSSRSLHEVLETIVASTPDPRRTRRLALVHRGYAEAQASYAAAAYARAEPEFARAAALAPAGSALAARATLFHGATLVYIGRTADGERAIRRIAERADIEADPALAGRAEWMLGTTLLRTGRYSAALAAYARARRFLEKAGAPEYVGAVRVMEGQAWLNAGNEPRAQQAYSDAVQMLRRFPASVWLHDALVSRLRVAGATGLRRAAEHLAAEDLAVTDRLGNPAYIAEARLERARLFADIGDSRKLVPELAELRDALDRLAPGPARDWLLVDARVLESSPLAGRGPEAVLGKLDSAVVYYSEVDDPLRLVPALLARGEARAAARKPGSDDDLQRVVAILDTVRAYAPDRASRSVLGRRVRGAYARVALRSLAAGDTLGALLALERGRGLHMRSAEESAVRAIGHATTNGSTVLDLLLLGDTLVTWTIAHGAVHARRAAVSGRDLRGTIERLRASLETEFDSAGTSAMLAHLYDLLVRPAEQALGPPGAPLTLIADGELAAIPFPALLDRRHGTYLVQLHPLRFSPGLLQRPEHQRAAPHAGALIVGDPAFDPAAAPGLERLPGARAEADRLARGLPGAREFVDTAATRAAFLRELSHAGVVHFAGHAVVDERRPDQSFLLFARSRAGASGDRLTAADIERLDLNGVRLVVLSGCETATTQGPRGDAFLSLAGAFLLAGAGGVVGSLWRVDDEPTRTLMVEFHRRLRSGGDAARALQQAALVLLGSAEPRLRRPRSWAAFRYVGN